MGVMPAKDNFPKRNKSRRVDEDTFQYGFTEDTKKMWEKKKVKKC